MWTGPLTGEEEESKESGQKPVLYAAKSTEDKRGSIPGQLDDCRAFAAESGLEVIAEYSEADVSAYSGNRGPEPSAGPESPG